MAIETAACSCLEIRASGVPAALSVAQAAFWTGIVGFALLPVILWIVTNKVLSPQYMLWTVTLMAAWGAVLLLAACALTQLLYPSQLMGLFGPARRVGPVVALGARLASRIRRENAPHG